jgi:DNA repair photolyase
MGKAIYQPSGKASEYSKWAVNFYNGCSAKCEYCYNRHGITAKILGADIPTLKKCLKNEDTAIEIFKKELFQNLPELQKHGLFFNFVSDPFLPETVGLNTWCMRECLKVDVPIKILTKQTWWIDEFIQEININGTIWNKDVNIARKLMAFGFTLTAHDEKEYGTAPNMDRIGAMIVLNEEGFKTWASIEPIIEFDSSLEMIRKTIGYCDLYKIGIQSGKHYDKSFLIAFMNMVSRITGGKIPLYFKDSLLKMAGIERSKLPINCVVSDYNIFKS